MSKKKRKLKNSSGAYPCEICSESHILEIHHINGRDIPNPNHSSNLVNICSNCHTDVHFGRIIIEGWAMTTEGKQLFWHKKEEENITNRISNPYIFNHSEKSTQAK